MLRLLLVDDEKYTREGIMNEIDWYTLGIDQVFEAKNGLEAYEVMLKESIDILISDVKMPKMNGIELAYKVQSLRPHCPIIFMSGYSDKEYLKSAIELNAVRYIEKPLDTQELELAIKKSINLIDQKRTNSMLQEMAMPIIKSNLAIELCKSTPTQSDLKQIIEHQYPKLNENQHFQTIVIQVLGASGLTPNNIDTSEIDRLFETISPTILWAYKDAFHIVAHVPINTDKSPRGLDLKELYGLKDQLDVYLPMPFIIGAGDLVNGVDCIINSYRSAIIAMRQYFIMPQKPIFTPLKSENPPYEADILEHRQFKDALNHHNYEAAKTCLNGAVLRTKHKSYVSEAIIINHFYQFVYLIVAYSSTLDLMNPVNLIELKDTISFFDLNNIDEIEAYTQSLLTKITEHRSNPGYKTELVNAVVNEIHKNFFDCDLSLQSISHTVHASVSHMCVQFKKETDMTINQYLIQYRLKKSMILLCESDMKLSYIAYEVGFNDGNYFTKLFKKNTGMTPSKYREILYNVQTD